MKRKKIEYRCWLCGKQIEYGSKEARSYDDQLLCSEDCAEEMVMHDSSMWDAEYDWCGLDEYEYEPGPDNAFMVSYSGCIRGINFFGNERYIILDKLNIEHDEEYDKFIGFETINSEYDEPDDVCSLFYDVTWAKEDIEENGCHMDMRLEPVKEGQLDSFVIRKPYFFKRLDLFHFIVSYMKGDNENAQPEVLVVNREIMIIQCNGKYAAMLV